MSQPTAPNESNGPDEPTPAEVAAVAARVGCAAGTQPVGSGPMTHAILRVARLHRMLAGQLLRRLGLHPMQELVMMQLWEHGPQRQSDLAALLGSDAATMTRTVRRLEHAGFVRRSPSTTDRRVTIITPTSASLALQDEVERAWTEMERSLTEGLTTDERRATMEALARIEERLARATARNAR
ncbi:hypothetical protein GCM10022245_14900 [Streptomyces mayteni]